MVENSNCIEQDKKVHSIFTFAIYHLIKNPNVVDKIRAEIEEILGKEPRPMVVEDLDKFKYVDKEAVRMAHH
jgi:hypothetical protein